MSTGGGQTKKPMDLLVALGVNDEVSRKNIHTYIKRLKNINALTINLDVKGHNTQLFLEYEKQIHALQQHLDALNQKLQSVGTGSSPTLSLFDEFKQQVTSSVKSIDQLNEAIGDANLNVKSFYKRLASIPTGDLQSLEQLLTQLKTEIETINFNQFKLNGIQETQQNLQALEANLYNIYELNKAYANNTNFEQLTYQISDLNTQINNIQFGEGIQIAGISEIPSQLESINQAIAEFGKNTKEASQSSTSLLDFGVNMFELSKTAKEAYGDIRGAGTGIAAIGKGLLSTFGPGLALTGIDFVFGKIIESSEKAKQKTAELAAEQKNILDTFTSNATEIDTLSTRYAELENAMTLGNTDSSVLAEYRDIANQLGEILPNIVTGEDEFGNKIIGSSEALKIKIGLLKEQQALEAQSAEQVAQEERDDNINTRKKTISSLEKEQKNIAHNAAVTLTHSTDMSQSIKDKVTFSDNKGNPLLKSTEDYENKIKELNKLQSSAEKSGNSDLADYYERLNNNVKHFKEEIVKNERELNQEVLAQKSDYISNIAHIIGENDKLTDSVKNNAAGFAAQLIDVTDASNLDTLQESLTSLFSNDNADTVTNDIIASFQNMENATSDTFDSMANETKDKISNMTAELTKLGLSEDEVNSIMKSLKQQFDDTTKTQKEVSIEMKANNLTFAEAKAKVFDYKEEVEKLTTTYEQLAGVSQKKVNDTSDLLFQYEMLTNQLKGYTEEEIRNLSQKGNLTAEERQLVDTLKSRDLIMNSLNTHYPFLLDNDGKAIALSEEKIKAIQAENHANETLLKAYKLAREGKLTADQEMMISSAQATKFKILNAKKEIMMLENYVRANEISSKAIGTMNGFLGIALTAQQLVVENTISNYKKELSGLTLDFDFNIGEIDEFTSSIESSKKASKSTNSTTKESIHITDKYKQTLDNLNLEIEKQVKVQSTLPKHSEEYRKSLQAQIELEKRKLTLIEDQEKSIKSQIAAGKINKTGTVSGNNATTSATSSKLNGWNGPITSNYGNRTLNGKKDFHLGVDIDGSMGQRLDSPINGKVIKSGDAAKNGEHESYGNIVMIQDDNGIKHLFAHMNETLVKIGDNITAGTKIGTIGNSGNVYKGSSDGSHLHYEVRKNDKTINPTDYLNNAKSGIISSSSSTAVETTQQAIDQAKSELLKIQSDILNQKELIAKIEKDIIDSQLSHFDWKRGNIQSNLDYEDSKLKLVDKSSSRYTKTIDLQTKYLEQKQTVNNQELVYLEGLIKNGSLSAITLDEMKSRLLELKTEMLDTNNAISQLALNKLETFDYQRSMPESQLEYENAKIQELDTNSARYAKTLQLMTIYMNQKQKVNRSELQYLQQQIANGKHSGEVLEQLKERYAQLTTEIKLLDIEIREKNYEILINIKTQYDEKNDNIEFSIERSKIIQSMFDEGSDEDIRESKFQKEQQKNLIESIKNQINTTKNNILQLSLLPEDLKKAEADLKALDLKRARLTAELAADEKKKQEELANKLIDAYKEYIQEKRDAHIKSIDDEIQRENDRHDTVMDNYKDEMDLFRKNIQDKLKLIDQQESQRDYDQDIAKLEKERNDIQGQYNLLLLDNSHEAKSKRKNLQEQLAQIDEEISEKRHDREIELRKESLNEQLEAKETEMSQKEELENEYHEKELNLIDEKKKYWEQFYTDRLNDERKFEEIRKKIRDGEFASLKQEFGDFKNWLTESMPDLEKTLTGTFDKVGTSIRQNIIEELEKALDLMNQVEKSSQIENGEYGSSDDISNNKNKSSLIEGDMQVLLGKFMTDVLAEEEPNSVRKASIREKAHNLAQEGRKNNSEIPTDIDFTNYITTKLSDDDLLKLSNFFMEQAKHVVITPQLQDLIIDKANALRIAGTQYNFNNSASALQGGMTNFSSNGIDGLGGKAMIVHPNELIHSPIDTKNLLSMANIMDRASLFFRPILDRIPQFSNTFSTVQAASAATYGDINIEFNIDKMNGDMNDLNKFSKMINDDLLRKKGMRN
ncbi:peptidoglycan DD-metalloendopeptidase family protein [Lysinibacillus parviboronicapiens]|uniref:peptidoglycan DD-metalloendopeptidase family protein n=1 Tax=Lysinibacillus parviboronicapiens TaxID=436516 RepID=UPI000D33D5DA|nr:peptidoglycan DD-metalloendopeptidase family protein [Lysinibacillus parviboronicapiens]